MIDPRAQLAIGPSVWLFLQSARKEKLHLTSQADVLFCHGLEEFHATEAEKPIGRCRVDRCQGDQVKHRLGNRTL